MFGKGDIVRRRRYDVPRRKPCPAAVRGRASSVHPFPVLIVRKPYRSVVAPRPALIRTDTENFTCFVGEFKLDKQFCLRAVLVSQTPCAAAPAIPAVRKFCRKFIFPASDKIGHIVRLILNAFSVIGIPGREDKIPDSFPVDCKLIQSACRDVKTCLSDILYIECLTETIHGIASLFPDAVVSRNPFCPPVGRRQKSRFKKCFFRPVSRRVILVPELNLPCDFLTGNKRMRIFGAHAVRMNFSAVPYRFSV